MRVEEMLTGVEDDEAVVELSSDTDKEEHYDVDKVYVLKNRGETSQEADPFADDARQVRALSGVSSNKKRSISALVKRYENATGTAGSKKIEDDIITGYNAFEVVLPPYNLDYLAKLYELSPVHKAAVDAKTSNIVGLGYDFIPSATSNKKLDAASTNDAKEKVQRKLTNAKNELMDWLDGLNEEDTFSEILAKVWKDYEATGNGYIEINREETTGAIGYIGHVPSTTIRIRRRRDGFVQIIANKAVFFRNFGKDDPDPIGGDKNPSEIIHIKKYAPSSTFYGVPDIVAAKHAIAGNEFSSRFNLDYFEHKAVPRHIITLKGATIAPRLAKNILEFFETGLKGKNHRSLFVPLPGDTGDKKVELKIDAVEAGTQDASFNNYRKENKFEILMAHRVPITKVGLAEGVALAVARDADKTFKEQVCQPEQRVFEKKINKFIKEYTDMFLLKLNELTLTDENTQSQIDERRIKTGTELPNEKRARRGQPAIKGGDERVDPNAAAKKQQADANANRQRDAQRAAATTDNNGEGRNPKGEGRTNGTT
jgi:PBSX family phage portal protein